MIQRNEVIPQTFLSELETVRNSLLGSNIGVEITTPNGVKYDSVNNGNDIPSIKLGDKITCKIFYKDTDGNKYDIINDILYKMNWRLYQIYNTKNTTNNHLITELNNKIYQGSRNFFVINENSILKRDNSMKKYKQWQLGNYTK